MDSIRYVMESCTITNMSALLDMQKFVSDAPWSSLGETDGPVPNTSSKLSRWSQDLYLISPGRLLLSRVCRC